ncbi:hypothetical protein FOVSG1_005472 [Fusarium oxysporum f. sp. vasinfectum]
MLGLSTAVRRLAKNDIRSSSLSSTMAHMRLYFLETYTVSRRCVHINGRRTFSDIQGHLYKRDYAQSLIFVS